MNNDLPNGFIPKHGGYRSLLSYQKAEIIYDGTLYFTQRFFHKYNRTVDQMVQAARSGKQNIAEGSVASATSKTTELKLTNVARASLEELYIDYEDFLRANKLNKWDKDHRLYQRMSELNKIRHSNYQTYARAIEHENPEICANAMICLVNTATYLLFKQIKTLESKLSSDLNLHQLIYLSKKQSR
jgi:four helix bundle protein